MYQDLLSVSKKKPKVRSCYIDHIDSYTFQPQRLNSTDTYILQ